MAPLRSSALNSSHLPSVLTLAVLTHPLAPYRMAFYDQVVTALGGQWKEVVVYGQAFPQDHQWKDLHSQKWLFELLYAPAHEAPKWCCKLLRALRFIKQPFVWPAVSAAEKTFACRPDVLWIAEYSSYTIPSLLWAYLHRVPVIVGTDMGRGMPRNEFSWISEFKNRILGRFVQGQVASSPWAMRPCYKGISNIVLAPHAVNTADYVVDTSAREQVPVVLFVGNLIPRKGIDLWFEACAALRSEITVPFVIRCVGGGDVAWAQKLATDFHLEELVEFIGFREGADLIKEYQRASIFVLPSRYDTYGAVAHEAGACGLPLILSKYAACSRVLIEEGVNGFVVDPLVPGTLAAAMKDLIVNPAKRNQMGLRSREIAEEWSVQNCGIKVARMIRGLISG